jgi:hypothetical protein
MGAHQLIEIIDLRKLSSTIAGVLDPKRAIRLLEDKIAWRFTMRIVEETLDPDRFAINQLNYQSIAIPRNFRNVSTADREFYNAGSRNLSRVRRHFPSGASRLVDDFHAHADPPRPISSAPSQKGCLLRARTERCQRLRGSV